ncbi:hypothetical protein HNP41_005646 [Pseudomonas aeruginosa]|nr:hypothetical protein [Pseudomonas aeruginosa]
MAKQAREAMGVEVLSAVADRGYFKGEEILACHEAGITIFVPKALTSGATAAGRFGKGDFIYDAAKNEYRCPAGQSFIWRFSSLEKGLKLHRYWSSHCQGCALNELCTPSSERRVNRKEHEAVLEVMQRRLDAYTDWASAGLLGNENIPRQLMAITCYVFTRSGPKAATQHHPRILGRFNLSRK